MTAFWGICTGSISEPYVIILGVTCHNMSHILTYFAYFRKLWWRVVKGGRD